MPEKDLLAGKRVFIVDDEPDVLETLEGLLEMCHVEKATNFDEAEKLLKSKEFDLAILDIMGVDGYKLLEVAEKRNIPAVMLTAHALTIEDTIKSFNKGAAYYVPKDEISNIVTYLADIFEAKEKGKHSWWKWLDRFNSYYERVFGAEWQNKDKEFWEKFRKYYIY